ncbi:cytochrome-c oxidase, cbb3-type subunit III [Aestuariibius sp. HNIBRBA575]|uniref:cytochrome-c oxidase, cbb3-type subunit III n=1 Tax=Aestuariibius sp. HNIBRBA575 TaxID=3233343 RepID=UPI0034A22D59
MSKQDNNTPQDPDTTGHSWDGIEEFDNPLPRWWLWVFYATIVWAILYTVAYPAWPLAKQATAGFLGYSTRGEVAEQIAIVDEQNAALVEKLASADMLAITDDTELNGFARNMGAAVFRANCSQCHGSGASGAFGFPNLLDDDWLWGGTIDDIVLTVTHGVRNEDSFDARWSEMPAFGEILSEEEITQVVAFVRQLSGQDADAALASAGEPIYLNECSACHMEDGTGDRFQGAPNLSDAIWLYGGDEATLTETVTNARFGVMPAWSEEFNAAFGLTPAEINAVSAYVHQLGGGE